MIKLKFNLLKRAILGFVKSQIRARPRLKFLAKMIPVLLVGYLATNAVASFVKPREAQVIINGRAILVAVETRAPEPVLIAQGVAAKLSPFEFRRPVAQGHISQGYSFYHRANDIAASYGSSVFTVGSGRVEFAGFMADGHGNTVIIDHGDGLKSLYAHLGKIYVGAGNVVDTKTALGTVGMTGRTTGPHVHLEIFDRDNMVNPDLVLPSEN